MMNRGQATHNSPSTCSLRDAQIIRYPRLRLLWRIASPISWAWGTSSRKFLYTPRHDTACAGRPLCATAVATNCKERYMWRSRRKMRQVVIYHGEDRYWVAECPSLPGCISQGKTKEEAIANIREAIEGYISTLEEDKLPIPTEKLETSPR